MKKFVSCLLVLVLLLTCTFAFAEDATIHYEGSGFDTAQDAVTCYMNGLKNLDFEQMLSAYAWETLASHYSVETFTKRIRAYSPTASARMPSFNDFMVSANLNMLRANEVRMIYSALEAYIMGEEYHNGMTITLKEESEVDAFLQKFDNGRLEQLSSMGEILFLTRMWSQIASFPMTLTRKTSKNRQPNTARMRSSILWRWQLSVREYSCACLLWRGMATDGIWFPQAVLQI